MKTEINFMGNEVVEEKPLKQCINYKVLIAKSNYRAKEDKTTFRQVLERRKTAQLIYSKKKEWSINVAITDHALMRWNSRVGGGNFYTKRKLAEFLTTVLSNPTSRYEVLEEPTKDNETWLIEIDNEILASVTYDDGNMVFTSFFGRRSVTPALASWKSLRHFITMQYRKGKSSKSKAMDKVKLDVAPHILAQQALPVVPVSQWLLRIKTTLFAVEKYYVDGQNEPVYLVFETNTATPYVNNTLKTFALNLKELGKPESKKFRINPVILDLLKKDGNEEFVESYRAAFYLTTLV